MRTLLSTLYMVMMIVVIQPVAAATEAKTEKSVGEQVAGYYHQPLGKMTVTALYDGYMMIPSTLLQGMEGKEIQRLLTKMFVSGNKNGVQSAVNAYLVDTGQQRILIDTGASHCFGPTLGGMLKNLTAAGYSTKDIDIVLLTHLHPDHTCGLTDKAGQALFPQAVVMADEREAAYWLGPEAEIAEGQRAMGKMARDALKPYLDNKAFSTFNNDREILPGISVQRTPGHTPGHSSYLLQSDGYSLLFWGDIMHSYAVQFPHPEVAIDYDIDAKQAVATRHALMAKAAEKRWMIGGAHLPFPGLGHIRQEGKGYIWIPVEYSPLIQAEKQ